MTSPAPDAPQGSISLLLDQLERLMFLDDELPDESTPIGRTTREFFDNNWERARTGLLSRTTKLRVAPPSSPAPRVFHFELDCTFKRKAAPESPHLERAWKLLTKAKHQLAVALRERLTTLDAERAELLAELQSLDGKPGSRSKAR